MSRFIDADALIQLGLQDGAYEYVSVQEIADFPTADVIEADNVQKTVETYCTDHCYHNTHCMELYKDVDDAVEYLERKCEKCPLRELRDLDMRGENNELHK